jgi:2-dehydro-3-deoxyphosphooctonate aldolase (KDO 8-P synthase)
VTLRNDGTVSIGDIRVGEGEPLLVIAGPCVIESRDSALRAAEKLSAICERCGFPLVYKSSYDKANRTSIDSYRGPGAEEGLSILSRVRDETGLPVISDVHSPDEAAAAGRALDALQIPAFLCRQTDLLLAAARTGRPVNVKKGQFLAPDDTIPIVEKIRSVPGAQILLTERGSTFGYHNLVVDFRGLVAMRALGVPVVFDGTHSTQQPGGVGRTSGGDRSLVPPLVRAAVAVGCDALFLEVHEDPSRALCDAATQLPLDTLETLLREVRRIREAVGGT